MAEAEITLDRVCEVLGLAASGTFTIDAEFKLACRRAVQIVRLAEALGVKVMGKPSTSALV